MTTWGAILAGGEGARLKAVTSVLAGDDRPKQFCPLLSGDTLFAETRRRTASSIPAARTLFVMTQSHRAYYAAELVATSASRIVEQPSNRGTAAAVAFALGRLLRLDAGAVVAMFPADHYYAHPDAVHRALAIALQAARLEPRRLVLLGARAEHPETAYGWIVPGRHDPARRGYTAVCRFQEKPSTEDARRLMLTGGLWNTFITVGTTTALLGALEETVPEWHELAADVARAATLEDEHRLVADAYRRLPSTCFSSGVLGNCAERCLVVPMSGAGWLDVGEPERLFEARRRIEATYTGAAVLAASPPRSCSGPS